VLFTRVPKFILDLFEKFNRYKITVIIFLFLISHIRLHERRVTVGTRPKLQGLQALQGQNKARLCFSTGGEKRWERRDTGGVNISPCVCRKWLEYETSCFPCA
jgi:hypothetical protein